MRGFHHKLPVELRRHAQVLATKAALSGRQNFARHKQITAKSKRQPKKSLFIHKVRVLFEIRRVARTNLAK
jgi:hypothetical protein